MKPRRTIVKCPNEIAALIAAGRYQNGVPLWWKSGDALIVESDLLKVWRSARDSSGNTL